MNLKEKEKENFHLPRQFSEECYNVIEVFQRERNVNIPMHVWDLQGHVIVFMCNQKQDMKKLSL